MSYKAAVITVSDKGAAGARVDTSGPAICALLSEAGYEVAYSAVVPDEITDIVSELTYCADELNIPLVVTTGGTGFALRDITPEATKRVIEREAPGICELMRAESLKITPRGCLSRAVSGIRKKTLIINLPGSKKAAVENLSAVMGALTHGIEMLLSVGSADCAEERAKAAPSHEEWLREAKAAENAGNIGMYLFHNGVVRKTSRAAVREGRTEDKPVSYMRFSYDREKADEAAQLTRRMPGIYYVKVWLNEGELRVGEDIMQVLIGGDTRPHTVDALNWLVSQLKTECVSEVEL